LGTNLTNHSSILGEIKSRLNSGNAFSHSEQNLLSSSLLPKSIKIEIYGTIILLVVFMGVKLGHSHGGRNVRLRVCENRVLMRIFGPERDEVIGECRILHMRSLVICSSHQISFGNRIDSNEMGGTCSTYGGVESCTQDFGGEN
jgi:hypothetical protein